MHKVKVFYDNKRGVRVTESVFSTRLKDEQLSSIVSVKVGREPFYITAPIGLGLIAFGLQSGDLLRAAEQMGLIFSGVLLICAGYSVASLTVGTLFNEKAVWWHDYWTVQKVRRSIRDAMQVAFLEERAGKSVFAPPPPHESVTIGSSLSQLSRKQKKQHR